MTSPFDRHRTDNTASEVDLLAWCDAQNRSRHAAMLDRWYFIAAKDGHLLIDNLSGADGEYARMTASGREVPDFAGWPRKRMDGYRSWLRGVVAKGILEPVRNAA